MREQWSNIRGIILVGLIFLVVFATDVGLVYFYYRYVQQFLEEQPSSVHADAGIVFFGDYVHKGTQLGPDSEHRAQKAVDLYKKGRIETIICVGGYDISYWKGRPHLMKRFLVEHGVPADRILHDSLSFNTITNWQQALLIMEKQKCDTVIAISAPLHIFRISRIIDAPSVYYSAYEYRPSGLTDYWQIFKDVHHEFLSHFLSFALKDSIRNQVIKIYRTIRFEVARFF